MNNLMEYCKTSMDVGDTIRYSYCPLHKDDVGRKGFNVTRTKMGWVMHCYKCGGSRFIRNKDGKTYTPPRSAVIKQVKKITTPEYVDRRQEYVYLPSDCTSEIPIRPLIWLQQYGITDDEIASYSIKWSSAYERLILPVYKDDVLVYWQGRYFGDMPNTAKYYNIKTSKEEVMFLTNEDSDNKNIVIVEDIISAIAVARTGFRSLALLGSYLSNNVVQYLLQQASLGELQQVYMWLDSDKRSSAISYSKRLNTFGINSTWLWSQEDPKCYSVEELNKFLGITPTVVEALNE